MNIWELLLLAAGLAMDAFAVAVCEGVGMKKFNWKRAFIIALFFGGFQALMPLIGWVLGTGFEKYITAFDHWIAFGLLVFLGIKMLVEGIRKKEENNCCREEDKLNLKQLFIMAVATSIDALAVGITFAFLQTEIISAISVIGALTFAISFSGVFIGSKAGTKFSNRAEIAGGVILILIGVKILLEHLGVIAF